MSNYIGQNVKVSELRRAYNGGKAMGKANVAALGLTYLGKPITAIRFCRYAIVEFIGGNGKAMARFQDEAVIDD